MQRADPTILSSVSALLALFCSAAAFAAAQVPPSAPVTVVNTTANPVPVTGTVDVSGTANVQITNTAASPVPVTGSVGVSGTANVQITNSATSPVPVSMASTKAIQISYAKDLVNLSVGLSPEVVYTVPTGFRLVIEYLELSGSLQSGEAATGGIYTTVNSVLALHGMITPVAPFLLGGTPLANQQTSASNAARIYADPGTDVAAQVGRSDGTGHAFISLVINGYLQPVP